jgi:hypothetical protein
VLSIKYLSTLILELMRQHLNYLRFMTSMDYHLEITKRDNCVDFFNFNSFLGVEGIISYHFFFFFLC